MWINDENFRNAVAGFLAQERSEVEWERRALEQSAPFRKDEGDGPPPRAPLGAPRSEQDEEGF